MNSINVKMKKFLFSALLIANVLIANAQSSVLSETKSKVMDAWQDSILALSDTLINDTLENNRVSSSYRMIKTLVKALKNDSSFYYPFDQLNSVSILYPDDKSFRIFTWQLEFNNGTFRYFGAIQMRSDTLKLFPLVDYTQFYEHKDSIIVDADRWIGAIYYQIIQVKSGKNTYYTLLGKNTGNAFMSTKYVDVLWFDNGKPKFGYPIFEFIGQKSPTRLVFNYQRAAVFGLNQMTADKVIYFDHLVSLSGGDDKDAIDRVPDGTIEALEWKKGKWYHISQIAHEIRKDGDVPNVIDKPSMPIYQTPPPR